MKLFIILFAQCLSFDSLAEVYKCNNNGDFIFSDKPCGKNEVKTKYSSQSKKRAKKQRISDDSEIQIHLGVQKVFKKPSLKQCVYIGEIKSYRRSSLVEDVHLTNGKKLKDITNTSFYMAKKMGGNLIYQRKIEFIDWDEVPAKYSDRIIGTKLGLRAYLLNPVVYYCRTDTLTSDNGVKSL